MPTHWLTWVALICVVFFAIIIISTNAVGWPKLIPGAGGYVAAALAICAGGFAFSLFEHIRLYLRDHRWPNLIGAIILFSGAIVIDTVGVHSGVDMLLEPWRAELQRTADADVSREQLALTQRRAELQREIDAIAATIPAVEHVGRPQADTVALAAWNAQHGADKARLDGKQTQLDHMPTVAAPRDGAPWMTGAIYGFAVFVEIVVAFGVTILGIEIAPAFSGSEEPEAPPAPKPQPSIDVVVPISVARPRRQSAVRANAERFRGWDD